MKIDLSRLLPMRIGKLGRGTIDLTAGMALRSLAQVGVFILVARVLGVATYGAFAAVIALGGALGGLTGCGTHGLLTRDTARKAQDFAVAWGTTLMAIALSVPVLLICYVALTVLVLPNEIGWTTILMLGLTELALTPFSLAMIAAYQGHDRIGRAARLVVTPAIFRLCGALVFLPVALTFSEDDHLDIWSTFYMASAVLAGIYAFSLVRKDLGHPIWPDWRKFRERLLLAWPFALALIATRLYSDIDKTMLARLSSLESAGTYSAGYRIVELATIPIISLFIAAMPTMFRKGEGNNIRDVIDYSAKIVPIPVVYAACAGIAIYVLADFVPLLLGQSFADTVFALQWLAWLPLLSLGRLLFQRQMLGTDRQKIAALILCGGALLNIAINLQLIPLFGWRGAIMSTYAVEIVMTLIMAWLVLRSRKC